MLLEQYHINLLQIYKKQIKYGYLNLFGNFGENIIILNSYEKFKILFLK